MNGWKALFCRITNKRRVTLGSIFRNPTQPNPLMCSTIFRQETKYKVENLELMAIAYGAIIVIVSGSDGRADERAETLLELAKGNSKTVRNRPYESMGGIGRNVQFSRKPQTSELVSRAICAIVDWCEFQPANTPLTPQNRGS